MIFFACVPVLLWCVLLVARGGFWRIRPHLAPRGPAVVGQRRVAVVIPARDEAASIGETVRGLLTQVTQHSVHVTVVDDGSSDTSAETALRAAESLGRAEGLTVLPGAPLPPGWTGKLWALSQGVEHSLLHEPDFLLFTDADIAHGSNSVEELVRIAETGPYDLTSFMVKLTCETLPEKLLIPAFVFFFFLLYPPSFIRSRRLRTAGAAGGCVLIRPGVLARVGGVGAIRGEVIDDCSLARAVKQSGGRVWLGLTNTRRSLRSYVTFGEIEHMIARTAFRQLNHSEPLLAATVLGLCIMYLAPPLLLGLGRGTVLGLGGLAWLLMSLAYSPMVRFYERSLWWSFTLPAAALFYGYATVHSAVLFWTRRGGSWKGRFQDVRSP